MAAQSCNYIIIYDGLNQVYSASSEATALKTPLPKGATIDGKHIFFVSYDIDENQIVVFEVDKQEVIAGYELAIEEKKEKIKDD